MQQTDIDNANVLIHIGCHKTASSWLQERIFDNSELNFSALHMPAAKEASSIRRLKSVAEMMLLKNASKQYLGPLHKPYEDFSATFAGQKFATDQTHVLSHERLSGNPHSGGFDRVTNCLKLQEILPSAKILMVFREQKTMIRSCYHQYIVAGGSLSLTSYMRMKYNSIVPTFNLEYFRYDDLFQLYAKSFGAENVLALPYEMFSQDPSAFLGQIQRFVGSDADMSHVDSKTKVNDRKNPWLLVKFRLLNRLVRQIDFFEISKKRRSMAHLLSCAPGLENLKSTTILKRQERREMNFIAREIEGFFTQSNQNLEALSGISLPQYGYE